MFAQRFLVAVWRSRATQVHILSSCIAPVLFLHLLDSGLGHDLSTGSMPCRGEFGTWVQTQYGWQSSALGPPGLRCGRHSALSKLQAHTTMIGGLDFVGLCTVLRKMKMLASRRRLVNFYGLRQQSHLSLESVQCRLPCSGLPNR